MSSTSPAPRLAAKGAPRSEPHPVLQVRDLRVSYRTSTGDVHAVNGVSFDVSAGEILGLVGESGSGKSTLAMAVLRLTSPPGRITGGSVRLNGVDLGSLSERALRARRWRDLSLVPQGSMNSLNPVVRVRDQLRDAIEAHERRQSRHALAARIDQLLELVRLPASAATMYPHELSGGMKQRVCIAMAIALDPALIIADEPTSALDVVVQRTVAQTLLEVRERMGTAMILIGHDMAIQAQLVDRMAVMYAGDLVEIGPVRELFARPQHHYTRHLISSVPSIRERKRVTATPPRSPDLTRTRRAPQLVEVSPGHLAAVGEPDRDADREGIRS